MCPPSLVVGHRAQLEKRLFSMCEKLQKSGLRHSSHMVMGKPNSPGMLSIPDHKELDTGLLRGLVRDSGMSVEQFLDLL